MSNATVSAVPAYFEESWSILSSIDLFIFLLGFMIIGITNLSPLVLVPMIVSAAGAIANGLCYYAFYAHYAIKPTVAAAAVADVMWLVQEAGMPFYSYFILIRLLERQSLVVFKSVFWAIMAILLVIRMMILTSRAKDIIAGNIDRQNFIDNLHIGYFTSIALVECIGAFFLLRKFASAQRGSTEASSTSGLFQYLMRSTGFRITVLAMIGFSRAITHSFYTTAQSATNVATQTDRFVYSLECLFPTIMYIDILASRLVVTNHIHESSSHNKSRGFKSISRTRKDKTTDGEIGLYSMNHIETRVDAKHQTTSSQERIIGVTASRAGTREADEGSDPNIPSGGISKTVEFDFHESSA